MKLTDAQRRILDALAGGRSLCLTQDGDSWFLSGTPAEFLDTSYDEGIQQLKRQKLIASHPDPEHWTDAHSYDITEIGRSALEADDDRT